MPGLNGHSKGTWNLVPYLFVLVEGGLVLPPPLGGDEVEVLSLQPANTPIRPNSTIRVINLFIVGVSFTRNAK